MHVQPHPELPLVIRAPEQEKPLIQEKLTEAEDGLVTDEEMPEGKKGSNLCTSDLDDPALSTYVLL